VAVGHGNDTGLVERQHEANFLLVGNGADELLAARSRQTENILDAVIHRDLQVGLRYGSLSAAVVRHLEISPFLANCSGYINDLVQKFNRSRFNRSLSSSRAKSSNRNLEH
jgi:hypothetical protein